MIFSELYSAYYNTVAKIISAIQSGNSDKKIIDDIIKKYAFGESFLTILPAIEDEKWQIVSVKGQGVEKRFETLLENTPTMPLTTLQKRWLKAISNDPRFKLFDVELEGLDDVEPLFKNDDFLIYDRYLDGDPFEDEEYIKKFRFFLRAIKNKTPVKADLISRNGGSVYAKFVPVGIEYSEKDDKFRISTRGCKYVSTVNLSRIVSYSTLNGRISERVGRTKEEERTLVLKIIDERKTCEHCMLHFAHFEKEAVKIDDMNYILKIKYNSQDETEMAIRVLSFGPTVKAVAPETLVEIIKDKLKAQMTLGIK